ncbi:cupredoxin domain-containing protein [Marinobacteraceae bacterium S3BR75-40.1]
MKQSLIVFTLILALVPGMASVAFAGQGHNDEGGHQGAMHSDNPRIGEPGHSDQVDRTIDVTMKSMAFEPEKITVEKGQTVRFKVKNEGQVVHEFNLGTASMHQKHQQEMKQLVQNGAIEGSRLNRGILKSSAKGEGMSHTHENSLLLEPGESGEIVWHFPRKTDFEFACDIPGHYQAGMKGDLQVKAQ